MAIAEVVQKGRIEGMRDIKARAGIVCVNDQKQPKRFIDFGWPIMNQATLGLDSGVFLIAAPPNIGKSTTVLNMYSQVILFNPDWFVLDFSLDDTFEDRVRNSVARLAKMPINWVKLPAGIPDAAKQARHQAYIEWRDNYAPRLDIVDETDFEGNSRKFSVIRECIMRYRDSLPDNMNMFISIDGFHNVIVDELRGDDYERQLYLSAEIKNISSQTKSIVCATTHTPKGSMRRGLSQDSVKGAGAVAYDAKLIATLYSDFKINRGDAEVYWDFQLPHTGQTNTTRLPVIELDVTKNKAASFSDIIFYRFIPDYAYMEEAPDQWQYAWRNKVFGQP